MPTTTFALSSAVRICAVLLVTAVAAFLAASPASAFVVGVGSRPGLALDAAGTAYLAWIGADSTPTLRFCRLPRGATVCEAGTAAVIATNPESTSGSRPFVAVSGDRVVVVQYRYPFTGTFAAGIYRYTSMNRGVTFGAGEMIGSVNFEEATVGPSDTLSGVPVNGAMTFQNVVLSGAAANPVPMALLSTTHQNQATVGLVDASTPLTVTTNSDDAEFRRYVGSGSLNDIANWTAPVGIGLASYPKLAGGPSGLVLVAGDAAGNLFARKWNGSGFGAPATIGPGRSAAMHVFQDAGGRLHAVYQRDNANPLQLVHAVSDDGMTWRSGTVALQDIGTGGGIADPRVATAADHVGVVVWHGGLGAGDIRVVAVGPDAPAAVVPPPPPPIAPKLLAKPKPRFKATSGSATRVGRRFRISVRGQLVPPVGVAKITGCTGRIKLTVKRVGRTIATKTVSVKKTCRFAFVATVASSKVKRSRTLTIRIRFAGNTVLAPVAKTGSIKVKR